ncbi:MAG: citrate/2-methylcitrate synthase [bacterium]
MTEDLIRGLEGVLAAETAICDLDGAGGRLAYCGYDVPEMVRRGVTYEETVYLLWHGELPGRDRLKEFRAALAAERRLPPEVVRAMRLTPPGADRMSALGAAVGMLGLFDPEAGEEGIEADRRKALRITAKIPTWVAAQDRIAAGLRPLQPRKGLGHAANFLYMLFGETPEKADARALEASLILYAEHEMNASTFTARTVSSTLSDVHSAVSAGIGALKGPLHGGAGLAVMETLEEIGDPARVESFVEEALARKRLLMGFGHRVYGRSGDPRQSVLREMAEEVGRRRGRARWFEIARSLDRAVQSRKGVIPNVDFYSAPLWDALGISKNLFVPVIAAARVAGWTANILEQKSDNRLIRPRARYTGAGRRPYKTLRSRG